MQDEAKYTVSLGIMLMNGHHRVECGLQMAVLAVATIPPLLVYVILQRQFIPALPQILVVADLFHPIYSFAVELFLNGDVCHSCCWVGTMPMLLAR